MLFFQLRSGKKAHCKIAGGGDVAAHLLSLSFRHDWTTISASPLGPLHPKGLSIGTTYST
jgi:hypothetical protein